MNKNHHQPGILWRRAGIILFLAGLLLFNASIFLGDYQYTKDSGTLLQGKLNPEQIARLTPLSGKVFASPGPMMAEIERLLNPDGKMGSYQLGVAEFWILKASIGGPIRSHRLLFFWLSFGVAVLGALLYIFPGFREMPGIKHNGIFKNPLLNRELPGLILGAYLIGFYILLYWFPQYIVKAISLADPVSHFLRRQPADRWFMYGFLYTLAVGVMGIRMWIKYRHNRYHQIRTLSVIFFQLAFAFLIPSLLERLNQPSMDFKNAWPLNYSFFMDWNLDHLLNSGTLGIFMLFWGVLLSLVIVPVLTYFFGKRWYCSWVCGCGGLAETLGDPFRQLSSKKLIAWRIERFSIHGVLVFSVVMTVMQLANYFSHGSLFGSYTWRVNQAYSFFIGSIFAGVIGTGFYPLMGNRVWCRFGCPLAAGMGIIQKFKSRFVITTNGSQCISCGNCSAYCEMGIDVRWYAQRKQNIVRASCVGCGVCAAVCPRGVLRLEHTLPNRRYNVVLDDQLIASAD